jgi:hypothetical protein
VIVMLRLLLALVLGVGLTLAAPGRAPAAPEDASATPGAASADASAARAGGRAVRVKVQIRTPAGVPASVRLIGRSKVVVGKPARGRSRTARPALRPGRYRVRVDDVVAGGRTYRAVRPPRTVRVSSAGRAPVVRVRLARLRTLKVAAEASGPRSVRLRWQAPKRARVVVRRAAGERAPAGRRQGAAVRARRGAATDAKVTPGAVYSYAVFVRSAQHGWRRGAVTVGVPSADGKVPPFSLAPGATVVDARDRDTVSVSGTTVRVHLAAGRATPALGAGMVLPISPAVPGGYVGTVAGVSPDGRVVTLRAGGLADVFASLDLRQAIAANPIELTPVTNRAEARARVAAYDREQAARAPAAGGKLARAAAPRTSCLNVSAGHQLADLRPILRPSGHWHSGIKEKWGIPYAATFDLRVAVETGFRLDLETSGTLSCALPLKKVTRQLAVYPVPIGLVLDPTVEIGVTGAVELHDVEATVTNGFWARGQLGLGASFASGPIRSGRVGQPSIVGQSVAITAKLGGTLTVGPGAVSRDVGAVAGVSGYFNPVVAELKVVGTSSPSRPAGCVSFETRLEAGLALEAKAWAGNFSWSASWRPDALTFKHQWHTPWYYPARCNEQPETGTGDVQATLTWNSTADLDLHVVDPWGEEIYYSERTSDSGGELDVDANAGCEEVMVRPTENIFWPEGDSPPGTYRVHVVEFDDCGDPDVSWRLVVRVGGRVVLDERGSGSSPAYTFTA